MTPAGLLPLLCTALLGQTTPGLDPAFFQQNPTAILVACADKARAARPRDSRMLAEFAQIYQAAGQRDRALDALKRAEDLGREDAVTQSLLTVAWLRMGAKTEALAAANRLAALAPRNKTLLAQAGVALTRAGLLAEGAPFLNQAYQVSPRDWRLTLGFGKAHLAAKNPDGAALWFRRTLTGRTDEEEVWTAVGLAYAEQVGTP